MKLVICVQLAYVSVCLTQLSVVREWTSLEVQLPPGDGQESRRSIMPSDIASWFMYKDRMFVTLFGHPYSLAYLDLTDNSTSPLLRLYPSWEARMVIGYRRIIIFNPFKVHVDRCDRLWVMSKMSDRDDIVLEKYYYKMTVFDLKTDSILRNIFFPNLTYFLEMSVDDFDCDNEYVYILDYNAVWTYSWAEGDSWRHDTSVFDRITSMIFVPNSIVYYNVRHESMVYYMSTTHLRDKSNKTIDILGRSRKLNVNLYSSALDVKSDVLYYFNDDNRIVIHAIPCWTSEHCSSNGQGDIDVGFDPTHELRYIALDKNGYLWAVTSDSSFDSGIIIKLRLLSVPVKSTCIESNAKDTTNTRAGVESNAKDTTNTSTGVESNAKDTTNTGVESNAKDTTNTSTGVESNAKDTTNTSTGVESNTNDTTNTSTGIESIANTTNIKYESTTAAISATDRRRICQILLLLIFVITIDFVYPLLSFLLIWILDSVSKSCIIVM